MPKHAADLPKLYDLENSQTILSALADVIPQIVWTAKPDGSVDYYNRHWYEFTGLTYEQTHDWGWNAVLHPEDFAHTVARWTEAIANGTPYEVEYRFKRADGTHRWFLGRANPVRDETGKIVRWFGTCTDIDDQKTVERELEAVNRRERVIADALQGMVQPILQKSVPGLDIASYYRAALGEASVGGDFSDVFPIDKYCHALIVGDMSGKGLAAASQVAMVRNMLRFALYTGTTLAEAVTLLNSVLLQNNLMEGFATLVVATFDLNSLILTYVSCGQEPALLRRTHDGDVSELPPTGPILGLTESAHYEEKFVSLAPGDAFALYTDGLTEAGPNRRHLLGVDGLAELLAVDDGNAQAIADRIIEGVESYAEGGLHDDVCLLVGVVQANGARPS